MNKTLKFRPQFVDAILSQDSGITTRMFDEKEIAVGDILDLLASDTGQRFASAKVTKVYEQPFSSVAEEASDPKGLYEQYRDYYGHDILPTEQVKFIYYSLLK